MLSKILISVAALLILAGLLGLKMKTVGKRLLFVCIAAAGTVMLSVAEMNTYGLVGGCFQGIYRILAIVPGILLFHSICKRNQVTDLEGLNGIGRRMPYTYVLLVFLCMVMTGIPVTGTFTGMIYSEIGLLAGGYGIFTYVGLVGNVLGIVVPVMLLFPMLRRMYFPEKEKDSDADTEKGMEDAETVQENVDHVEEAVVTTPSPAKSLLTISWLLAAVLFMFSLYQQPVLVVISTVMQKFFS
ncbi:MAG: hypothetical protein J6A03_08855 [Lachnospiraceae bacterium]|nr:hypothetical protein [Lachnospiraceae bacterium]